MKLNSVMRYLNSVIRYLSSCLVGGGGRGRGEGDKVIGNNSHKMQAFHYKLFMVYSADSGKNKPMTVALRIVRFQWPK